MRLYRFSVSRCWPLVISVLCWGAGSGVATATDLQRLAVASASLPAHLDVPERPASIPPAATDQSESRQAVAVPATRWDLEPADVADRTPEAQVGDERKQFAQEMLASLEAEEPSAIDAFVSGTSVQWRVSFR